MSVRILCMDRFDRQDSVELSVPVSIMLDRCGFTVSSRSMSKSRNSHMKLRGRACGGWEACVRARGRDRIGFCNDLKRLALS